MSSCFSVKDRKIHSRGHFTGALELATACCDAPPGDTSACAEILEKTCDLRADDSEQVQAMYLPLPTHSLRSRSGLEGVAGCGVDGAVDRRHAGSSNQNVLPAGTPGSTPIVPPWASTASLQNARPNPTEW